MVMNSFQYVSYAQEVVFEPGALARIGVLVERYGLQRLMLCTSRSQSASGCVISIEAALGGRLAAVYDSVRPHVLDVQVEEAAALAEKSQIDGVIGLGGGSPIGMAKALSYQLGKQGWSGAAPTVDGSAPSIDGGTLLPVVAVPATYAGSEMTAVFGITHTREDTPRKVTVRDPRIAPRLVIYDPELTLDLPPEMTASTGFNALAHCFEALYSVTRNPVSSSAAVTGIRHIVHALPRCYADGGDLDARSEMLLGAHLAGLSLASVKMALHHGLCHVLGGAAQVPHGIANAIMLPHALRFNAPAAGELLLPSVEVMGIPIGERGVAAAVEAAAQRLDILARQMNLPRRLRDAGVKERDLPELARLGFENRTVHDNPRPVENAAVIENILRKAW